MRVLRGGLILFIVREIILLLLRYVSRGFLGYVILVVFIMVLFVSRLYVVNYLGIRFVRKGKEGMIGGRLDKFLGFVF